MEKLKLAHNEKDSIRINQAFDGLHIGIYNEADDLATGDLAGNTANPDNIFVKLTNKVTNVVCFDLTLAELHAVCNRGEMGLSDLLSPQSNGVVIATDTSTSTDPTKQVFTYGCDFPVYHGDYELEVSVQSDCIEAGNRGNSYVSVMPNRSTEAMTFEMIIIDETLDKKDETFKANGVQAVVIMDKGTLAAPAADELVDNLNRFSVSSREDSFDGEGGEIYIRTGSYLEDPNSFAFPQHILHDVHLLTDFAIKVEMDSSGSDSKLYLVTLNNASFAGAASEEVQENSRINTLKRLNTIG